MVGISRESLMIKPNFNGRLMPTLPGLKNLKSWVIVFGGEKAEVVEEQGNEDKPDRFQKPVRFI